MTIEKLQYITQDHPSKSHSELAFEACSYGIRWIQLRMKQASDAEWAEQALECKKICEKFDAVLIINDNVDIAARVMAHGVHLGKLDLPPEEARKTLGKNSIIGGTANAAEDIVALVKAGVNYIGLGPFRHTETKKNLSPVLGSEGYQNILQTHNSGIPFIAIGGITPNDIEVLLNTGIYGIAVSGSITNAKDKKQTIESFLAQLKTKNHKQDATSNYSR